MTSTIVLNSMTSTIVLNSIIVAVIATHEVWP